MAHQNTVLGIWQKMQNREGGGSQPWSHIHKINNFKKGKKEKENRLVYKLDKFCESQNNQIFPKCFKQWGYYRTSQDDYLKRTFI